MAKAEAECRRILDAEPGNAEANHLLGVILFRSGRRDEALSSLRRAIALNPQFARAYSDLAAVLGSRGKHDKALVCAQEAVRLDANSTNAQNNLGVTLERWGRLEEAAAAYRAAIASNKTWAVPYNNLGNALRKTGRLREAVAAHEQALALKPYIEAYNNLAATLAEQGEQEKVIECHRRAVALAPSSAATHSDLIYSMLASPRVTPGQIYQESLDWANRHADTLGAVTFSNGPDPQRRLRVGYVSPDFRDHPVARFIEPVLREHDRSSFDVFCYSAVTGADRSTERLRSLADSWRDIARVSDSAAADLIRSDNIDILVDLAGHTAGNRLLVFARRPVPVQVSYLGYPATTGMKAIGYRITDHWADPPGNEALYSEELVRLPDCAWCYQPPPAGPKVGPLPALTRGHVTFAALHRQHKITPEFIELWSRILAAFPDSRLLVAARALDASDTSIIERYTQRGIDRSRIEIVAARDHPRYLNALNGADLALDAFPYNGTTTTCDALWMGLPVVTLAGKAHVSRTGASLLSAVGLQNLVATNESEYFGLATALAADPDRLNRLRSDLRDRMARSPLTNARNLTRAVEHLYRTAWAQWCGNAAV